jgi:hypothetical protein
MDSPPAGRAALSSTARGATPRARPLLGAVPSRVPPAGGLPMRRPESARPVALGTTGRLPPASLLRGPFLAALVVSSAQPFRGGGLEPAPRLPARRPLGGPCTRRHSSLAGCSCSGGARHPRLALGASAGIDGNSPSSSPRGLTGPPTRAARRQVIEFRPRRPMPCSARWRSCVGAAAGRWSCRGGESPCLPWRSSAGAVARHPLLVRWGRASGLEAPSGRARS